MDLFVSLAEIAGVFVGFGALISVTRRVDIDASQLAQIRAVVVIGLVVMVAALVPVGLARYGVVGRTLWSWSSIAFLALIWVSIILPMLNHRHRAAITALSRGSLIGSIFFLVFLELPIQIPLVLAVLGSHPALEPAFYTTALVVNLFEGAFVLTQLVFSQVVSPSS